MLFFITRLLRATYARACQFFWRYSLSAYAPALAEVTVLLPPSMQKYKNNEKQMENNENNWQANHINTKTKEKQ